MRAFISNWIDSIALKRSLRILACPCDCHTNRNVVICKQNDYCVQHYQAEQLIREVVASGSN